MKTKKELRKIALKAWRTRRMNQTPDYFKTQTPTEVNEEIEKSGKKRIRHLAALKAWETRRAKKGIIPESVDDAIVRATRKEPKYPAISKGVNENEIEKHGVECAKLLRKMVGVRAFATVFQVGNQVWRLKISRLKRMPPSKPAC